MYKSSLPQHDSFENISSSILQLFQAILKTLTLFNSNHLIRLAHTRASYMCIYVCVCACVYVRVNLYVLNSTNIFKIIFVSLHENMEITSKTTTKILEIHTVGI